MSETKILIGGGFSSESAYPIIISGIADNAPFSDSENVTIPYTNENDKQNLLSDSDSNGPQYKIGPYTFDANTAPIGIFHEIKFNCQDICRIYIQ